MSTLELIQNKSARIGILGLGYVGLPLALNFNRNGYKVLGLDIDTKKTTAINEGRSYIEHIPSAEIAEMHGKGLFEAPPTSRSPRPATHLSSVCPLRSTSTTRQI